MDQLYYSSTNGERDGRASHFYRSETNAGEIVDNQNAKAEQQGLKVRYKLTTTPSRGIESKDIRD